MPFCLNPPTSWWTLLQVDAPFETIRYSGIEWWNNCTVLIPQMVLNGRSANTKPCLDTSKWWINGPSKTIWMVVQLATNTVQMVSPCVYKTNGHFWKWKFWMVSDGLSVGGLMIGNYFTQSGVWLDKSNKSWKMRTGCEFFLRIHRLSTSP